MIDAASIDHLVKYGEGLAAQVMGQTYDVFRLSGTSSGSILNPESRIISGIKMDVVRTNQAIAVENTNVYDMIFTAMCDSVALEVGDIVTLRDRYRNDGAIYAVAQLRPNGYNVLVRTEIEGQVARPWGEGDSEAVLGYVAPQNTSKTTDHPLILKEGFYYHGEGSPAVIPFGMQPYKRLGPAPKIQQPTTTHRTEVFVYVPNLPGVLLEPGDVLTDQNGNRYQIHTVVNYTTGMQGYQCIAESLFT